MESHRIGVISDTHGLLRPEVAAVLESCEIILHAGDIGKPEILARLKAMTDTYAVLGNVDQILADQFQASEKELSEKLPEELEVELFGFRIYMIHNRKQIRKDLSGVDIVVYGHSHKYEVTSHDNMIWLNPGSCGPRRFRLPVTMMILTLYPKEHRVETEKIDCLSVPCEMSQERLNVESHTGRVEYARTGIRADEEIKIPEQDIYRLIREIMKEVDAGRKISDIAARNHVDVRFAEQVCRMYLTHPGVDVNGILERIEKSI